MSAIAIALIVSGCVFGGAIIGMILRAKLPDRHLDSGSMDCVKLVMGLLGTMSALVLGLLIASAKGNFDAQSNDVKQLSASILELDRMLAFYGDETKESRNLLRQMVTKAAERIWPSDAQKSPDLKPFEVTGQATVLLRSVLRLTPQNDMQRFTKDQALQILAGLGLQRTSMYAQSGSAIAPPFLIVLVAWLVLLFTGFGMTANPNAMVIAALLIGALSVSGAIFLILELDRPYGGLIEVSSIPIREAITEMNQ